MCGTRRKVLVLGSGEFVWQPFLLAERLEADGAETRFSSLTRSPIAPGMAIESVIAFTDNYGLGIPNFIYNVGHQHFDRVILCVETPQDPSALICLSSYAKWLTAWRCWLMTEPVNRPVALCDLDDTLFRRCAKCSMKRTRSRFAWALWIGRSSRAVLCPLSRP